MINGRENEMDVEIRFVAGARKKIDGCLDRTRPLMATGIEPLKKSLTDAKRKGVRISYITVIYRTQQYVFDTFWDKAIPAQLKVKEMKEGFVSDFIDTIKEPQKIKSLPLSQ